MEEVKTRNGHEPEFIQAVQEVAETVIPYIASTIFTTGKIFYSEWWSLKDSFLLELPG